VHAIDEIIKIHFDGNMTSLDYFFAGGGSYTHPRAVNALYPDARVTVAEIDPAVTWVAQEWMNVDTSKMKIHHHDARLALRDNLPASLDVIIGDVFHDVTLPYHLTTREYLQLVKSRLRPGGFYAMNIVDTDVDPKLVKSIIKTLQSEFNFVDIWLEQNQPSVLRQTYVISASNNRNLPNSIHSTQGFKRQWVKVTDNILQSGTPLAELPLLTDDYVPVERLIAALVLQH
jgi:spermidine synthase